MTKFSKLLLAGGAILAAWYIPTIVALKSIQVSLSEFVPTGIFENKLTARIGVNLHNNSSIRVDLNWLKADIIFNGVKIAEFYQQENFILFGNSTQRFNINFTIDAKLLGDSIWKEIIANNLQNSVLQIIGNLKANDKTLPFETIFTINDITI